MRRGRGERGRRKEEEEKINKKTGFECNQLGIRLKQTAKRRRDRESKEIMHCRGSNEAATYLYSKIKAALD